MSAQYDITDFEKEVLEHSHTQPVVVDFWAEWCEPCHWLAPVIEELAEENTHRWKFVKIDTEREQELAARYSIRSIPALKIFHKGRIIGEFNGMMFKPELARWIDGQLPEGE